MMQNGRYGALQGVTEGNYRQLMASVECLADLAALSKVSSRLLDRPCGQISARICSAVLSSSGLQHLLLPDDLLS